MLDVQQIFPHCEQRFCVKHHHANFRKEHRGKKLKDRFYNCVRASTMNRFDRCMQNLRNTKVAAHTWVVEGVSPRY